MPIKGKAFITFAAHIFKFNTNGIRFLHRYSSSAASADPNHFLLKYLVDSLGFSREEAITTSAKVISRKKSPKNPDLVVNFLKQTGLDQTQTKELILKVPELLYYTNVNKTIKPKFYWLKELGLSVPDLVSIVSRDKAIIGRSLDAHLRSRFDCLRLILGCDEHVLKVIKRCSWLLTFGHNKTVTANISLMQEFGMSGEQIKKLVLRRPSYISQSSKKVLEVLHVVERDFGVLRTSAMFVYAVDVLFSVSKVKVEAKMGIFKSFGWSDTEVFKLFGKMPYCFNQSEARIEKGLSFFVKELGCMPAFLTTNPAILAYSLEKRVLPRFEVFKVLDHEKLGRRKTSFFTTLYLSESKFIEYFVLPYKNKMPHLYESLMKTVSH